MLLLLTHWSQLWYILMISSVDLNLNMLIYSWICWLLDVLIFLLIPWSNITAVDRIFYCPNFILDTYEIFNLLIILSIDLIIYWDKLISVNLPVTQINVHSIFCLSLAQLPPACFPIHEYIGGAKSIHHTAFKQF